MDEASFYRARAGNVFAGQLWWQPPVMARKMSLSSKRAAEKQRSREEDERRLQWGEVTPEQLAGENSFFNLSPGIRIVDYGRPLRRRYRKG